MSDILPAETIAWAFIDHHQAPVELHGALTDLVTRARNDSIPDHAPSAPDHTQCCPSCGGSGHYGDAAMRAINGDIPDDMRDVRWAVNVLLETIAKQFEAWDTMDLWRSQAADTVRSHKHDLAAPPPQSAASTDSPNPVVTDHATTETPEPDAVREALPSMDGTEPREYAAMLIRHYVVHADDPDEGSYRAANAILAALSRPAHGGWQDIIEQCAKIADDHTPRKHEGTLAAHVAGSTIASAIRALARNDRQSGGPQS